MTTYLIIGASRGIGLALAQLVASRPDTSQVFATVRDKSTAPQALVSQSIIVTAKLDATSSDGITKGVEEVSKQLAED